MHRSNTRPVVWHINYGTHAHEGAGTLHVPLDFDDLLHRLGRLEGCLYVLYLGVLADGRLPLPEEPVRTGCGSVGPAGCFVSCVPPADECRRFHLKPRRLMFRFAGGVRMVVEVDQVVDMRVMQDGLGLLLKQGRAVYLVTKL